MEKYIVSLCLKTIYPSIKERNHGALRRTQQKIIIINVKTMTCLFETMHFLKKEQDLKKRSAMKVIVEKLKSIKYVCQEINTAKERFY